jgi:AraC-like DNA-binding protein
VTSYHAYTPSSPLANYVECFWACLDVPFHRPVRILPSGTIELVINLCEDEVRIYDSAQSDRCTRHSGAVIAGPYKGCLLIDPMHHSSVIGVHFKPRGAFPFLGAPADELVDMHIDLDALWGRMAVELRERLCAAKTINQRFALLEEALIARLQHAPRGHDAVSIAMVKFNQAEGRARIQDVARRIGLSQRRFIQVFAAEVGLTPKLFCRVRRFQRVRELLRKIAAPDWTRVAAQCGYCDQSHLIRDFQALSGLSPVDYLRQSTAQNGQVLPNHGPQA